MITDLIARRRSVFPAQYNDKPIAASLLRELLEAANWAPTHKRTEPWRFKVLHSPASRERLGKFLKEKYLATEAKPKQFKAEKLYNNPVQSGAVIAICMQRDPAESLPEWEEVAATAMAVQNMWLVCAERNLGCYWSSPGLIRHMDAFFELQPGERCLGFFYMGYYDGELEAGTRGPVEEKTEWL